MSGRITHLTIRIPDWTALKTLPPVDIPQRQRVGRRGEEDASFYLRTLGYIMVARNFRSPLRRGEIDLLGWKKDVLCFIEIKTRTTRDVKPAEAAVDREKQKALSAVAREYLRHAAPNSRWRFDVVSVYYDRNSSRPIFELFQNAHPAP